MTMETEHNLENKTPGYILLHRCMMDKPYFTDSQYVHLWIYILLKANHTDKMHKGLLIKRGSFKTGRKQIAQDTWINESKIERMLDFLESEQEIEQQKTKQYRVITVVGWDKWQKMNNKTNNSDTTDEQQKSTGEHNEVINNNINDKNEKKINIYDTIILSWKKLYPNEFQKDGKHQVSYVIAKRNELEKQETREAIKSYLELYHNKILLEDNTLAPPERPAGIVGLGGQLKNGWD